MFSKEKWKNYWLSIISLNSKKYFEHNQLPISSMILTKVD